MLIAWIAFSPSLLRWWPKHTGGAAADFGEGLFGEAAEFSESAESGHSVSAEESGGTAVSGDVSGDVSGAALVSGVEPEVVAESVSGGGLL
ncbi:MAG: hypothetical protein ACKPHU_07430, partial [Planctomycetaceae bacterium]